MKRFLWKGALLLLLMFYGILALNGQCLPDQDILNKIVDIQTNTSDSYAQKIGHLKELQHEFIKCHPLKNGVYAQIVHRIGDIYNKAGDLERAIIYTKEAVKVNMGKGGDPSSLTNNYFNLGIFYKKLHFLKESHHYFGRCIESGRNYPDKHFIVFMAYEQTAYSFFQTGDYEKSIEQADEGLFFAAERKDRMAMAPLLAQKAQSEVEMGMFADAEVCVRKAISLLEGKEASPEHLATSYSVYADLLQKSGKIADALSFYHQSLELNKSQENWEQCSRDLLEIGRVYLHRLNQKKKAVYYYNEGLKMAQKVGDSYQIAGLYSNIGVVYWKNNDFHQALKCYQKALNVLPLNFSDTAINSNLTKDMLKLVANDYFVSTILANKGAALLGLYRKEKNRKTLMMALKTYEIADQAVDIMRWKQDGEQSKLIWRKKTKEMYEEAIEVCYLLQNIEKAYYFFEKSRAVLLNDKLCALFAENYLAEKDRNVERQLRVKTYTLSTKLLSMNKNDALYKQVLDKWQHSQDKWESFIRGLEEQYPTYYQYKYDNSVYPYPSVKNKLREQKQSLIAYFTGDSVQYALLLSPEKQKLLKIPYQAYGKDVKSLLNLCSNKSLLNQYYGSYEKVAFRLYQQLIAPLKVPEGRVIVSLDDQFIPFDALLSDSSDKSSFLAKKYIFSYVHSMRVMMKKINIQTVDEHHFLGIAPSAYNQNFNLAALPGADQSLKNIVLYFKSAKLIINRAATRAGFLNHLSRYEIVQIYAHAAADSSRKDPVLYMADSTVSLSDIQKMSFPHTSLLVLSACNTGVGYHAEGEGVFSLARAFMTAGVPSTLTNLWQVDNKTTYQLTERFYKYLQEGIPKDVALNRAKLDFLLENDQLYQLPYFWAATIVLGNTDGIENSSNCWYLSLGIALILFAGLTLLDLFLIKKTALIAVK
ncbi:CHAT domain-containing protein [Pedobacter caeni]|uniref:Tetratricopeptide repeat-containing protein n=1 Tax=Pedobacter caeni TaxID=288992 RepID=A0A1M4WYL6_9SPHI|nr:CHAT domain-containing protein [Pedobacter caeni]SHE86052.1 Tetratricopeptide repeat-containing protein [Pedobacter caeni]